jgi:hypothetical protein
MKNLLIRVVYAALCFVMFMLIMPLFLSVIGFAPGSGVMELMKLCAACFAVIYVIFGPAPPTPW